MGRKRTGTIYVEVQRNLGKSRNSSGNFGRSFVKGVGLVQRRRYVAEIMVMGKRYRFRSTNYYNCKWWLSQMVNRYENE